MALRAGLVRFASSFSGCPLSLTGWSNPLRGFSSRPTFILLAENGTPGGIGSLRFILFRMPSIPDGMVKPTSRVLISSYVYSPSGEWHSGRDWFASLHPFQDALYP